MREAGPELGRAVRSPDRADGACQDGTGGPVHAAGASGPVHAPRASGPVHAGASRAPAAASLPPCTASRTRARSALVATVALALAAAPAFGCAARREQRQREAERRAQVEAEMHAVAARVTHVSRDLHGTMDRAAARMTEMKVWNEQVRAHADAPVEGFVLLRELTPLSSRPEMARSRDMSQGSWGLLREPGPATVARHLERRQDRAGGEGDDARGAAAEDDGARAAQAGTPDPSPAPAAGPEDDAHPPWVHLLEDLATGMQVAVDAAERPVRVAFRVVADRGDAIEVESLTAEEVAASGAAADRAPALDAIRLRAFVPRRQLALVLARPVRAEVDGHEATLPPGTPAWPEGGRWLARVPPGAVVRFDDAQAFRHAHDPLEEVALEEDVVLPALGLSYVPAPDQAAFAWRTLPVLDDRPGAPAPEGRISLEAGQPLFWPDGTPAGAALADHDLPADVDGDGCFVVVGTVRLCAGEGAS